jgi:hypothetical protein
MIDSVLSGVVGNQTLWITDSRVGVDPSVVLGSGLFCRREQVVCRLSFYFVPPLVSSRRAPSTGVALGGIQ